VGGEHSGGNCWFTQAILGGGGKRNVKSEQERRGGEGKRSQKIRVIDRGADEWLRLGPEDRKEVGVHANG